ncbi:MAG: hypothetical protein GY927_04640 [bacterium]|nr:hypothetical protein [bacterium]
MHRLGSIHRAFQLAALVGLSALAGCQGSSSNGSLFSSSGSNGERPVQLQNSQTSPTSGEAGTDTSRQFPSARMELDKKQLAKAVERYRLNKKQKQSPFRSVGYDLNGDGGAEALILLEGEGWCAKTGCTLAVFTSGKTGYRPVATIRRVWGPVIVTSERNNGWSDLVANTGLPSRDQRVRLRFGANGYPGNAVTLTPMPSDIESAGEVVLERAPMMSQEMVSNTQSLPN